MKKLFVSLLVGLAFLAPYTLRAQQRDLEPEILAYADMVLYNGKVLVADDNFTIAEAIAIRDGKILAVGKSGRIKRMAGPKTRQIDLKGKTVTPGFMNTHAHNWVGNISKASNLRRLRFKTKEEALKKVKRYVDRAKPGDWVWINAQRQHIGYILTREDLDPIAPNNPLALSMDNDTAVTNSLGLKLANITPDIPGAEKDPKTGEMNGRLHSFASAKLMYEKKWPELTEELIQKEIVTQKHKRGSMDGVTLKVGRAQGFAVAILNEVWKRGKLQLRARLSLEFLRNNPGGEAYLRRIGNLTGFGDDWMRIAGLTTQHPDGGNGGDGGRILTTFPKLNMKPSDPFGPYGQNRWAAPLKLKTETDYMNILLAIKYGWDISSIHSMGDASHEVILQVYKEGMESKARHFAWKKPRLTLDHNVIHSEKTIQLLKELNVIPSVAVHYVFGRKKSQNMLIFNYGADRTAGMVPVKSLIDAGLKPTMEWGSGKKNEDGSSALWFMQTLVTRKDPRGKAWQLDQRVDRKTALWMVTNWSSRYIGEQDKLGTLEFGKLADFVVLGGDYMEVEEDKIGDLPVLMTVIGGKVMYERPDNNL